MKKNIFIFGSSGKMGSSLTSLMEASSTFSTTLKESDAHALIDFSAAEALKKNLATAEKLKLPIVIGTTGHDKEVEATLEAAAKKIPVFFSSNFSLGVALCVKTLQLLKKSLPPETKITLEETHHISKKDAPSGTALMFAHPLSLARESIISHRSDETLFIHEVHLTFGEETITLKHESFSRNVYAEGALMATEFLLKKSAGLYTMEDLIGQLPSPKGEGL